MLDRLNYSGHGSLNKSIGIYVYRFIRKCTFICDVNFTNIFCLICCNKKIHSIRCYSYNTR